LLLLSCSHSALLAELYVLLPNNNHFVLWQQLM
jgi:hypothetical protein